MRKYKRRHYAKFAVIKYYPWPDFDVLTTRLYVKLFDYRLFKGYNIMSYDEFDLVDEMQWEDLTEFLTLEEAELENADCDTVGSAQRNEYYSQEI